MARTFVDTSSQRADHLAGVAVASYPCTMSSWFNVDDNTQSNTLLAEFLISSPSSDYVQIHAGNAATVIARIVPAGEGGDNAATTTTYSNNTWHHACGVFTNSTNRAAFLDGGGKGTTAVSRSFPATIDGMSIAARYTAGGYTGGAIGESAMWAAALTDAEVAVLALGYSPLFVRPESLVAYWPFISRANKEPDIVGGFEMTRVGSSLNFPHPPQIKYPGRQILRPPTAAAVAPVAANYRRRFIIAMPSIG